MTTTMVVGKDLVCVPGWVQDHESFRRWLHLADFPEAGRICYLNGGVIVDMSKEQVFTHNQVKNEFAFALTGLSKAGNLGRYFPDGLLISNVDADLTSQPDGAFASKKTLRTQRFRLVEGVGEGFVEMEGTPDMVLEVVSPSSVEKDTVILVEQYWQADIPEYWLVDVRGERLDFDILRHTGKGYMPTRKQGDWVKSAVFGKSFRLTRGVDDLGNPEFTLAVR